MATGNLNTVYPHEDLQEYETVGRRIANLHEVRWASGKDVVDGDLLWDLEVRVRRWTKIKSELPCFAAQDCTFVIPLARAVRLTHAEVHAYSPASASISGNPQPVLLFDSRNAKRVKKARTNGPLPQSGPSPSIPVKVRLVVFSSRLV